MADGDLTSVTMEYDYARAVPEAERLNAAALLAHIEYAASLVRGWTSEGRECHAPA